MAVVIAVEISLYTPSKNVVLKKDELDMFFRSGS